MFSFESVAAVVSRRRVHRCRRRRRYQRYRRRRQRRYIVRSRRLSLSLFLPHPRSN